MEELPPTKMSKTKDLSEILKNASLFVSLSLGVLITWPEFSAYLESRTKVSTELATEIKSRRVHFDELIQHYTERLRKLDNEIDRIDSNLENESDLGTLDARKLISIRELKTKERDEILEVILPKIGTIESEQVGMRRRSE